MLEKPCDSAALMEGKSPGFEGGGIRILAVPRAVLAVIGLMAVTDRGVALEWQADEFLDASASLIQCATHGALFLIESGECVAGPCEGKSLRAIDCGEDAQGIWINPVAPD